MKESIDKNFDNILSINGFNRVYTEYKRNDGVSITCYQFGDFSILNENGETINIKDKVELIGYLALNGIINRLF